MLSVSHANICTLDQFDREDLFYQETTKNSSVYYKIFCFWSPCASNGMFCKRCLCKPVRNLQARAPSKSFTSYCYHHWFSSAYNKFQFTNLGYLAFTFFMRVSSWIREVSVSLIYLREMNTVLLYKYAYTVCEICGRATQARFKHFNTRCGLTH